MSPSLLSASTEYRMTSVILKEQEMWWLHYAWTWCSLLLQTLSAYLCFFIPFTAEIREQKIPLAGELNWIIIY